MKILKHSFRGLALLAVAITLLVLGTTHPASAASGVVGNGTPASCTEAAFDAVLATQPGKIKFKCGAAVKTITLTTPKLLGWDMSVNGGNKIILQASTTNLFTIPQLATIELRNIVLKNGKAELGGAILNEGTLYLIKVAFENNKAAQGGAIFNRGTLISTKSVFTSNQAKFAGGAIYNDSGVLKPTQTTFTRNKTTGTDSSGGAIYSRGGGVTLQDGLFTTNESTHGSAIYKESGLFMVTGTKFTYNKSIRLGAIVIEQDGGQLTRVLIDHNTANSGAGIVTFSGVTVLLSTVSNNAASDTAGGIFADGSGLVLVDHSTLSGNSANVAGAMYSHRNFTIFHSTISNNRAALHGGGVWTSAVGYVKNSTLSGNQSGANGSGGAWYQAEQNTDFTFVTIANNTAKKGSGIFVQTTAFATVHIANGLFAKNTGGSCGESGDTTNGILSAGNNLADDGSCQAQFNAPHDLNNANPKLGPLAYNGGTTWTHLPGKGSKAIDAAQKVLGYTTDQRGFARPANGLHDIGAVEVE